MPNYKVSLSKLNANVCKRKFASTKTQYLISRVISFISSKIRSGIQNTGALSQVLFIITFQESGRERQEEENRGVWSPCVPPQKNESGYNRFLDDGTRRRITEDSMSSM